MPFILFIILTILSVAVCHAQPVHSIDELLNMSDEQLMDGGRRYFDLREPGKALPCYYIVSERNKNSKESDKQVAAIKALNNCGCVYKYYYYDYSSAYEYFSRAYDLCQKTGHKNLLPIVLINLGDLLNDYITIYKPDSIKVQAPELLTECFTSAAERKSWELLTTSFMNLASNNFSLNLQDYNLLLSDSIPADTPDLEYARLLYKGIEKIQQKDYAGARGLFEKQLDTIDTPLDPYRYQLAAYINIARTYELEQDYDGMAEILNQVLAISTRLDIYDLSAFISRKLSECYRQLGDEGNRQKYAAAYMSQMEILNQVRNGSIDELTYMSELKKREAEQHESTHARPTPVLLIVLISAIFLTAIGLVFLIRQKNKRKITQNKKISESLQQMTEAQIFAESENKYSHSNLNEQNRSEFAGRIQNIFNNTEIICSQGFNLKQLAEEVASNTTYVSQIINEMYGTSFSNVLGRYRVEEACRRIMEVERYRDLTIEGMANDVGFKSRTAFINAFKRELGVTPSEYLRTAGRRE